MRAPIPKAIAAFLAVSVVLALPATAGAPIALGDTGRVTVLHVASADTDVPIRDVWVYRPPVPDSAALPVVYFLHGLPGQASDLFEAGGAAALDALFTSGVPPFVLAAPTGSGNAHGDTEWADSVDGRDRLETYLVDRVIPAVEGSHLRNRAHRIIAGFSMGGYGAANIALRHPDVFGAVGAFAGYFHIDDPDAVFGHDPNAENANDPESLITTVHNVRFWLADGDQDDEPVVRGETPRFAALAGGSVDPRDVVIAPGHHDYTFVQSVLPAFAAFVARVSGSRGSSTLPRG